MECTQVVPFTPASGLLEWCEDTEPLGVYLLGADRTRAGGAHERYRAPGQLSHMAAMGQYNADLAKDVPSDPAKRCAHGCVPAQHSLLCCSNIHSQSGQHVHCQLQD